MGGSPGLVVMGGDSCSKDRKFESQHRILDGQFFTYLFLVKFVMCGWKDKNKWKRGRGWPILKKQSHRLITSKDAWKKLCWRPVWPDWAIYWTLGNFLQRLATNNLPKSPTFLGIFVKLSKSIIFLVKYFWATFIDIWRFFSGHTAEDVYKSFTNGYLKHTCGQSHYLRNYDCKSWHERHSADNVVVSTNDPRVVNYERKVLIMLRTETFNSKMFFPK